MVTSWRGVIFVRAYRVYHLDGAGKVSSAEWIEAADDDSAIESARRLKKTARCELWQGSRLIGTVDEPPA
jgi:hypothetical protein